MAVCLWCFYTQILPGLVLQYYGNKFKLHTCQPKKTPKLGRYMNVQRKRKLPQMQRTSMQDYYNIFSFFYLPYYFFCCNCKVFSITHGCLEGIFCLFYSQLGRMRKFRAYTKDQSTKGGLMEQEDEIFLRYFVFCEENCYQQLMCTALRNLKMEILHSSLITCIENAVSKYFSTSILQHIQKQVSFTVYYCHMFV